MKKVLVFLLIFVPCLSVLSLESIDLEVHFSQTWLEDFNTNTTSLEIMPSLTFIRPRSLLNKYKAKKEEKEGEAKEANTESKELQVSLIFGFEKEENHTMDIEVSQFRLGVGVGWYYSIFEGERITFKTGPKTRVVMYTRPSGSVPEYRRHMHIELGATLPMFLDIKVTDSLFFRAGVEIPLLYSNILLSTVECNIYLSVFARIPSAFLGLGYRF